MSDGFTFRQFYVQHTGCAMKVGTDGVLLGAWALLSTNSSPQTILDIGTGSGLIALMLAQRFPSATITGIDIDADAVNQAAHNFAVSPWADRLKAIHCPLQQMQGTYELIVSNPPYFVNSLLNPNMGRATARHTQSLSYVDLIHRGAELLSDTGAMSIILPAEAEKQILLLADEIGLHPNRICSICSKPESAYRRIMITLSRMSEPLSFESLTLEDDNHGRSDEYKELTKEFYL